MDVSVSDGGAAAPVGAPIDVNQSPMPTPLGSQVPQKDTQPEPVKSARDAIRNASEQVKAKEAAKPEVKAEAKTEPKQEAKPVEKNEPKTEARDRDQTGKFTPRAQAEGQEPQAQEQQKPVQRPYDPSQPHRDAPARFSPDAKAEWEAAPEKVKAEVHRALRELEQGHQKYKADAESFESVRKYADLAKQNGGSLDKSLAKVMDFEETFARDPVQGFQKVADHFGISLHSLAAHILNQNPDEARYGQEQTVATLKHEISSLKRELSGLKPIVQEYKASSDEKALSEWAADKPHFSDLRSEVVAYVKQGYEPNQAYEQAVHDFREKAASFGFSQNAPASSAEPQQPKPLNPAGLKSISGAPASGSNPSQRPKGPAPSIRDAITKAAARAS